MAETTGGSKRAWKLTLGALGVVYGDIGTSPLYALRECFHGVHAIPVTAANVLGVLSLVLWSLILVISIKYLIFVLRADNRGEGGILALMTLACGPRANEGKHASALVILGLFGAALLYGDGVITPAISILSALEGLEVAAPGLQPFILPLAMIILLGLFSIQRHGTARVGVFFGPVTLLWFFCLAALGAASVARHPGVLQAFSPHHAVAFFLTNGARGFLVLGSVFLVVTGGEALYADMGHFGRAPIRRAWFWVVLPALMMNYLGQGAVLLEVPGAYVNPFYYMAPSWALYPLIVLSTAATVIASQAVITGAFSVTWQAVQLGYLPRFHVLHTSEEERGQIFIPRINTFLLVATIALVLAFKTSSNLAAAYGIAVTTTMVITTLLAFLVMRRVWGWSLLAAGGTTLMFLILDLGFFGANLLKIADGGWLPLLIGAGILTIMLTWRDGRQLLGERLRERAMSLDEFERRLRVDTPTRVQGTAVYLTNSPDGMPPALWRTLRHMHVLHERIVLLRVQAVSEAHVPVAERLSVAPHAIEGLYRVTVRYGFMEMPFIPKVLDQCRDHGLIVDQRDVTYVLGRETLVATNRPGLAIWREKLFAFLARNAGRATEFFRIPAEQVIEIGSEIEL